MGWPRTPYLSKHSHVAQKQELPGPDLENALLNSEAIASKWGHRKKGGFPMSCKKDLPVSCREEKLWRRTAGKVCRLIWVGNRV